MCVFFFKQKTAYEMRISDWSSDVCSSDLTVRSASPKAVHLRASRSTFSHHAVIHHDASPAAIAAAGALLSEAPALRCHDASPAPLSMPMATYASPASTPARPPLAQPRPLRGAIRARPRSAAKRDYGR